MSSRSSRRRAPADRRAGLLRNGIQLSRRHGRRLFDALLLVQLLDAIALVGGIHQVSALSSVLLRGGGRTVALHEVVGPGLVLVGALIVTGLCAASAPAIQSALGEQLATATAADVLGVAGALDLSDFDKPEVLDRLKRAELGASIRPAQLAFGLGITLSGLVGALALTVGVLALAPWLALVAVAAAAPLWWAAQRDGSHNYRTVRGLSRLERRRMYLAGLLTRREHAAEIRCFDLAPAILERYRRLSALRLAEVVRTARQRVVRQVTARAVGGALLLAGAGVLVSLVVDARITLPQAIAAGAAGAALRTRLADAASGFRQMQEAAEYIEDHARLLADYAPPAPASRPDDGPLAHVELRGVGVTYPGMSRPALCDVDLTLRAGRVVALVGANGSGKSTLAAVAAGLLAPTDGQVCFNGVDRDTVPPQAWRRDIAVLLQSAGRYQESIRDNVAFGDVHRDGCEADVRRALLQAGGEPIVDLVRGDLDAAVGSEQDGGIELSGGQWQRLALARVFYRGGQVLILDEPSAPLDPIAEHDLIDRLHKSFADRAVLLVTHRMSAAACADEVVVLDQGRVVERGRPADLMDRRGQFALMCHAEDSLWRPQTPQPRPVEQPVG